MMSNINNRAKDQKSKGKANPQSKSSKKSKNKKRKLPASFLDGQSLELVSSAGLCQHHERGASSTSDRVVVEVPPVVHTEAASDVATKIFFERFKKELVDPLLYDPSKTTDGVGASLVVDDDNTKNNNDNDGQYVMKNGRLVKHQRTKKDSEKDQVKRRDRSSMVKKKKEKVVSKIWKDRIVMGTNQCTRLLERLSSNESTRTKTTTKSSSKQEQHQHQNRQRLPSLIVLARDVHPSTMLSHIPVLAMQFKIPLLLLPGRSSVELAKTMNRRRVSIITFLPSIYKGSSSGGTEIGGATDDDDDENYKDSAVHHRKIDSFVDYISNQIIPKKE